MSPENDKRLCERYPQIFRDRDGDPRATLMCFGFDCGDGWYDIIDTLCNNISAHVKYKRQNHKDMPDNQFEEEHGVQAVQVKEKWGGLRFYVNGTDDYVRGLIDMAESMSYRTCERCGNPGQKRTGGWVRTLCDGCYK
jgi:hypothetical protein